MTVYKHWRKRNTTSHFNPTSSEHHVPHRRNIVFTQKKLIPSSFRPKKGDPVTVHHYASKEKAEKPKIEEENNNIDAIAEMKTEMDRITSQLYQEFDQEKKEIYEKGIQEGIAKGQETERQANEALKTELNNAIQQFFVQKEHIYNHSKDGVIALALEVAKKVIHHQIQQTPEIIETILKDAIQKVTDNDKIVIIVNKEDIQYAKRFQEELQRQFKEFKDVKVIEDPNIQRGGCLIETDLGFVDATIQSKLTIIQEAFSRLSTQKNNG